MPRYALILLMFLVTSSNCDLLPGQDDFENVAELKKQLSKICSKNSIPSLTIAATSSDKTIVSLCAGVRKRGSDIKVEINDLHPIGSNTKSMTATLAAVMVESGKIQWDTTIAAVWPKLDDKLLHPKLRDVTLNELLNHASGIRRDFDGAEWNTFFLEKSTPREERRRMLKLCLPDEPEHQRGKFHYSNLGFVVAAAMLEERADKDFETLMKQHVFKPLKMNSAIFRTRRSASELKPPLLFGHNFAGLAINPKAVGAENPSAYASAGTVNLTADDYAKFLQWHLRAKPEPVLNKQNNFDHLHRAHTKIDAATSYGCGWIIFDSPWGHALQHAGSNTNSFALTWILLEKNVAATALTNSFEKSHFKACDEAIALQFEKFVKK